jgi:hypothetical protein
MVDKITLSGSKQQDHCDKIVIKNIKTDEIDYKE